MLKKLYRVEWLHNGNWRYDEDNSTTYIDRGSAEERAKDSDFMGIKTRVVEIEASSIKTESKHTPGPWTIGGEIRLNLTESTIVIEGNGKPPTRSRHPIAYIPSKDNVGFDMEYKMGNARLIAAAPELLNVAKCSLAHMDCNCSGENCNGSCDFSRTNAAIAKAEGR